MYDFLRPGVSASKAARSSGEQAEWRADRRLRTISRVASKQLWLIVGGNPTLVLDERRHQAEKTPDERGTQDSAGATVERRENVASVTSSRTFTAALAYEPAISAAVMLIAGEFTDCVLAPVTVILYTPGVVSDAGSAKSTVSTTAPVATPVVLQLVVLA